MCIAYFAHELRDPAVNKRVRMLTAGGVRVELLGFERGRHAGAAEAKHHVLGRTESGKFLARIASVFAAVPRALKLKPVWGEADAIIARNLEMLALVCLLTLFSSRRPRIIYECLDIHRLMLGRGPATQILRAIERVCLGRCALLITSSPAFESRYFRAMQGFAGQTLIVENKALALDDAANAPTQNETARAPWRIAWCGVLRCRKSFDALRAFAAEMNGLVEIDLWGAPALDQIPYFHTALDGAPHIRFHGAYRVDDLPAIYGRAHFVWAIDYYEQGGNSDWLLPNRLYEGLRYGVPPIAVSGVETARWLAARRVGLVLDEPVVENLRAFLSACTPERYAELRAAAAAIDPRAILFRREDCVALAAALSGAAPQAVAA